MRTLQKLINKIDTVQFCKNDRLSRKVTKLLRSYSRANRDIHELRNEISAYNRFWSRYLSVIYCTLTVVDTYFAYMLLMVSSTKSAFEITFFVFFGFLLFAMLFAIAYECSVLVDLNVDLLKLQRKFSIHLKMVNPVKLLAMLKVKNLNA